MNESQTSTNPLDRVLLTILAISLIANVGLTVQLRRTYSMAAVYAKNLLDAHKTILAAASIRVDMAELTAGNPPELGRSDAPVTIVVFSDFQCPFCRRFAASLKEVEPKEKGRFRLVFRQFPLTIHSHARNDAELAACTFKQSNSAFWALHDYLFDAATGEDPSVGAIQFLQGRADIKLTDLQTCLEQHQTAKEVDRDMKLGQKYGVSGTPTIFVNGVRSIGVKDANSLARLIEGKALAIPSNPAVETARAPEVCAKS